MRSLVSSAQRALFRYAGWTAFAAAIANVSVQPAAARAPYGFGGVTAAGLPVSSQSSSGGGIEHYSPFTGALGMSVPLYHVGGRGDGGFDIVWNLQPNWIANRNGGTSSVVAIDRYPSSNIAGTSNAYALGGPGNVYIRTGDGVAMVNGVMVFPNGVTYRIDNSTVSWIRDHADLWRTRVRHRLVSLCSGAYQCFGLAQLHHHPEL